LKIVGHRWHVAHHLKGKSRSTETRKRISEGQLGKIISRETCRKISKALKGKKWSKQRKQEQAKRLKKYFKEHPRVAAIGKPWKKLGVSRRTWYRRERKRQ
jgi:hypothetical protein